MNEKCAACIHCEVCGFIESEVAKAGACDFYEDGKRWTCEDAISRSAVFEQINCWIGSGEYRYTNATDYLTKRVANLSSIQPEPKTGHWIYSKAVNTGEIIFSECSVCGHGESRCAKRMNYCPNCGAKMNEPQESEGEC